MGWVENNSWTHPPFFSRHLVQQNLRNIISVCYFLNIGLGPTKSQWSPHFSKQSIPGLPYLEPHRKVNATTLELRATNFKNSMGNSPIFQKSWILKIPLFGETECWKHGVYFDAEYVSAPSCHVKTTWIAIWSKILFLLQKIQFFSFSAYRTPIGPL